MAGVGRIWRLYGLWPHGETDKATGRADPQTARFDLTSPRDDALPSKVVPEKDGGRVSLLCPLKVARTEFEVPSNAT